MRDGLLRTQEPARGAVPREFCPRCLVSESVPDTRLRRAAGHAVTDVRVGAGGIHYQATLGNRSRRGAPPARRALPSQDRVSSDVLMVDSTTGAGAEALVPTGPGDLVEQLDVASARWLVVAGACSCRISADRMLARSC